MKLKTKKRRKSKHLKGNNRTKGNGRRTTQMRRRRRRRTKNNQKGGNISADILNVARMIPHTTSSIYNGLVGEESAFSFLPWQGHYGNN